MWGSIDMMSRKWRITIYIYWLRIGVRSHIFSLNEPYTKVSKETKLPTIGIKLLIELTTTFIASSRLSHWYCFFVYYLLTDAAFSLKLITKIISSSLQECTGQDALKRCYYPVEHRSRQNKTRAGPEYGQLSAKWKHLDIRSLWDLFKAGEKKILKVSHLNA